MAAASPAAAPSQPPGLPAAGGLAEDIHQGIARDIGQQVEAMILDAKHKSESTVSKEVQKIKFKMEAMSKKIKMVTERVSKLDSNGSGPLLKTDLQKSIQKLEEVWEGEVGGLKHELWQTIQAHNHNADLLKHHKSAIDQIAGRASESVPNPELENIHNQLIQVDKVMQREQAKEQQLDQLMLRLTAVQQQLSAAGGGWVSAAYTAAANNPQGKKTARKQGQGKSKAKPTAASAAAAAAAQAASNAMSMRAEAPEFVPTTGWTEG
jgi:uncharacterized protein YukE